MTTPAPYDDLIANARHAIVTGATDTQPVVIAAHAAIGRNDAATAASLVTTTTAPDRNNWLPEALVLFATKGLAAASLYAMANAVFAPSTASASVLDILARSSAIMGRIGFSFPQWRFTAQPVNGGASVMEHFGLARRHRVTDIRDPALPDPQKDRFGTGLVFHGDHLSFEYRRAYILCADRTPEHPVTVVIRNSSYFFGRDRLPQPVYVSWHPFTPAQLENLDEAQLSDPRFFTRWLDVMRTATDAAKLAGKLKRVENILDAFDQYDRHMSAWLFRSHDGLQTLAPLLEAAAQKTPDGPPFIGWIDRDLPQWFPTGVMANTHPLRQSLHALFAGCANPALKPVLLSGPHGDGPLGPRKKPSIQP